ncbi:MAG: stage IV sporulation protein A [Christensenellales bacterium]
MEKYDIYKDIALRTQGDIYIGVVGPVRTGKSTFIKKFTDLLVLPNINNPYNRERVVDEMPQSGAGRMIMTTQPKFVPNEAVEITLNDEASLKVRMIDCVGYLVRGALGHMENDMPRMVRTPWYDYDIPFEEAAELGTRKVITDHSTIGIVVTTDGSITDIARSNYIDAEERVIKELKELNKPFVVILNSAMPSNEDTKRLREAMQMKYDAPVLLLDVMALDTQNIQQILEMILYEFPIKMIDIQVPQWVEALSEDHWLLQAVLSELSTKTESLSHMRDHRLLQNCFDGDEQIGSPRLLSMQMGEGIIHYEIPMDTGLFYRVLGEQCGCEIKGDGHLFITMRELMKAKKEYDRIAQALQNVKTTGYGMVAPHMEDLMLEEPEIIKQGSRYGVRLKASAPSLHIMSVDVKTEVSPVMGSEKESQEMIEYLLKEFEHDPAKIWETNIFGKSLHDLMKEGLDNKLGRMPEDIQGKIQVMLQRMVNEGAGGMVCILL